MLDPLMLHALFRLRLNIPHTQIYSLHWSTDTLPQHIEGRNPNVLLFLLPLKASVKLDRLLIVCYFLFHKLFLPVYKHLYSRLSFREYNALSTMVVRFPYAIAFYHSTIHIQKYKQPPLFDKYLVLIVQKVIGIHK